MLFDGYRDNLTIEECRAQFTPDEMSELREAGQHVIVSHGYFSFGDSVSPDIMDKLKSLFNMWLDTKSRMEDSHGLIVETMNIIPQEREARKEFQDFFMIYAPDEKTNGMTLEEQFAQHGRYDCAGLFVKFIHDLGVEIGIEIKNESPTKAAPTTISYGKSTGISIITEEKRHNQIRSLALSGKRTLPGQQRYELHEDGSFEIVVDNEMSLSEPVSIDETTIAKALMNKNPQGYDVGLLRAVGAGIEQIIKDGESESVGRIAIPREGLQSFLNRRIRKPTQEHLDFILARKAPKTDREKELYDEIIKSYSFWVDLINLSKAGTYKTKDGIFLIFVFHGYNEKNDTIECDSPFLRHVYEEIYSQPILGVMKNNKIPYTIYRTSAPLIKGSLYNDIQNEITKEIIEAIIIIMSKRGTKSDAEIKKQYNYQDKKKITINISYQSLIKMCPLLQQKLTEKVIKKDGTEAEPDAGYKRTILNRAIFGETYPGKKTRSMSNKATKRNEFDSLIEYAFHEHTGYYESYANFSIKAAPISLKALNRTGIKITHEGIRGEYKNNPSLHSPEIML